MIAPQFYNKANYSKNLLGGKRNHFPQKDRTIVLKYYDYIIQSGDTVYSLADKIFGSKNTLHWTIIAELNPLRPIDEWNVGDKILLPEFILKDQTVVKNGKR